MSLQQPNIDFMEERFMRL